jgi:hypothetical protein
VRKPATPGSRRRAENLVEADRLRELLADELVTLRKIAVLCKRLLDTLGVATAQRPGGVPRQQDSISWRSRSLLIIFMAPSLFFRLSSSALVECVKHEPR